MDELEKEEFLLNNPETDDGELVDEEVEEEETEDFGLEDEEEL